jgi:hypothetical protein
MQMKISPGTLCLACEDPEIDVVSFHVLREVGQLRICQLSHVTFGIGMNFWLTSICFSLGASASNDVTLCLESLAFSSIVTFLAV